MDKDLKNKLSQLSPQQLKELMKKLGKERQELPRMPRNPEQEYPASSAQKRMWFLSKLDEDSHLYTNPIGIRLKTSQEINIDLYVAGLKQIVERHEIMRTSFFSRDGDVYQRIHAEAPVEIEKFDLKHFSPREREQQVNQILSSAGQSRIGIEDFPLFQFKLLLLSEQEFVFIYNSHHIISDAWSTSFIFRQMLEIYEYAVQQQPWSPPSQKYQFVDYVLWEKTWFSSPEYQKTVDVWKTLMPAAPEPMRLPSDFVRPPMIDHRGALEKTVLDAPLVSKIEAFSKKEGVNLFHTLLAVFNVLLHKYSKSEEIVVGLPLANRKMKEFQEVVGMFLNTLPHRTTMDPNLPFLDYLQQVKSVSLHVVEHQDYPFDQLIEQLNPKRELDISPIFQVLFVFQNIPSMYRWRDLEVSPVKPDYHISKYDLNLWLEEVDGTLFLSLTYQTSLFCQETIRQFLRYYECLLEEAVTFPDRKIADLQIENKVERFTLPIPAAREIPYIQAFEANAGVYPNAPALYFGEIVFSYAELNTAANQLAQRLLKAKPEQEQIIAFALDRSPDQIIAILGINKCGAAYLPIDPQLPAERIRYILQDARVKYLVTEAKYSQDFQPFEVQQILMDSPEAKTTKAEHFENPGIPIALRDRAYVIYTSGTTGMPKGVIITHDNLANYSQAVWKRMKLDASARFASVTSVTTDLGNTQIFPAFTHGAALDLIPDAFLQQPDLLAAHFAQHKISCLKIVPSLLESLLNGLDSADLLPQDLLILGGEKVKPSLILAIRKHRPELRILNHYGPTETTIGILTHEIGPVKSNSVIPLGAVLDNNIVRVVDDKNRPVADGYPGELVVAGRNVGLGYLHNEALTSRSFVWLEGSPGLRFYKTGDLVRKRFDDTIEFLGRIDRQIKVRGYRVEPEGIEKILLKDPAVAQTVVVEHSSDSLAAYVVAKPGMPLDFNRLRQALSAALPDYMLPEQIVAITEVPRLGNGKIDYQNLKNRVTAQAPSVEIPSANPRDETELLLAQIWEEVLKTPVHNIHASFFELGGNSLKAIELIARVNGKFGTRLGLGVLFEQNSIANLASLLKSRMVRSIPQALVRLKKGSSNTMLFLVHPAGGDVLSYYELARCMSPGIQVYGLQTSPGEPGDASIEAMAERYLALIKKQIGSGNFVFGGWSMGALVAFEMAKQVEMCDGFAPPVIVLDQKAPSNNAEKAPASPLERISVFADKIDHLVGRKTGLNKAMLEGLDPAEQSALFLKAFKANNLVPEDLALEDFHGFLDKMILHNEITMDYRATPYAGNLLLIKAADSTFLEDEYDGQPCYGWSHLVLGDFNTQEVPGNHITLIRKPNVSTVAETLNSFITNINLHPALQENEA